MVLPQFKRCAYDSPSKMQLKKNGIRSGCRSDLRSNDSIFLDWLPDHGVDALPQFLARLEMWHPLFGNHHLVA